MRIARLTIGLVLIGAGLVFVAQGLDLPFAPRSVMTRDTTWVVIGAVLVFAGAALALLGHRREPPAP
jgi:hypothetical protein